MEAPTRIPPRDSPGRIGALISGAFDMLDLPLHPARYASWWIRSTSASLQGLIIVGHLRRPISAVIVLGMS